MIQTLWTIERDDEVVALGAFHSGSLLPIL